LAHISGKTERIFLKILLQTYAWTMNIHSALRMRTPNLDQIRLGGGMRSPSSSCYALWSSWQL